MVPLGPERRPLVEAGEDRVHTSVAATSKLHTLARLTELVSSSLDADEILRRIAAAAVQFLNTRYVSLWVADEATRTIELRAYSDAVIGAGHPNPRLAYGQGVAGWVALRGLRRAGRGGDPQ